jgi:hypothetical protein
VTCLSSRGKLWAEQRLLCLSWTPSVRISPQTTQAWSCYPEDQEWWSTMRLSSSGDKGGRPERADNLAATRSRSKCSDSWVTQLPVTLLSRCCGLDMGWVSSYSGLGSVVGVEMIKPLIGGT